MKFRARSFTAWCVIILFSATVFFSGTGYAQQKYFVYFKDKVVQPTESITASSPYFQTAVKKLSPRSIERRMRSMGSNYITYQDVPVASVYTETLELAGLRIENSIDWLNAVSVFATDQEAAMLKDFVFVERVEPVRMLESTGSVDYDVLLEDVMGGTGDFGPAHYGKSFTQLRLSSVPDVHALGITGEGVTIGFLDTGFDFKKHAAFKHLKVKAEHDFIFSDDNTTNEANDADGQHDHGTHCFSLVAGYQEGIFSGIAYNAVFVLAKTEDTRSETQVEEDNYAKAVEWMENQGADIISSSLGYAIFDNFAYTYEQMDGKTTVVARAVDYAYERGILAITAAGNEGNDVWQYITSPADAFNVITVGAVTSGNRVASFSSVGPTSDGRIKPDVVAMGVSVFGVEAGTTDGYVFMNGTSSATPIVCGVAGLLLSAHPHLTNVQMRYILTTTADNSASPDTLRGNGLVSALDAVLYPNIEVKGSSYILHKMFNSLNVEKNSAVLHYRVGTEAYAELPMQFDGKHSFTAELPASLKNKTIEFYFTYKIDGAEIKSPNEVDLFNWKYGDVNIASSLKRVYKPGQTKQSSDSLIR